MNSDDMSILHPDPEGPVLRARVCILETTDLHMQLLGYDYFADYPTPDLGLIPLAGLIEAHRNDPTISTLLFDNGDFLQGNPLADYVAGEAFADRPNPMIAAFNELKYDAVTLGNHEFNYGVDVLTRTLQDAAFPVVCANVHTLDGKPFVAPYVMIDKQIICDDGQMRTLRVGVIGLVTPQIIRWDKALLAGKLMAKDIVTTAKEVTSQMREQGAEVIVALCHSGIGCDLWSQDMENATVPLAALPDIDVVLTGHTHDHFPDPRGQITGNVDAQAGKIHGKPVVQAGFYGSHLGVITLDLLWADGWQIERAKSGLESPDPARQTALQEHLADVAQSAHSATLAHIRQPIAHTDVPINSFFATTAPDLTLELLAVAQREHVIKAMRETDPGVLPVLSAVAPYRVGGRGGPNHFIEISEGPLTLRDAAAIYPFTNKLYGIRRTGAQMKAWLEKSARYFNTLSAGVQNQPLINPDVPPYDFDVIYGLTYRFDVSGGENRVVDLCYGGVPVRDGDAFIVATNSYRANGGGNFFAVEPDDIAYISRQTTRDILIDMLSHAGTLAADPTEVWRFVPMADTAAQFTSNVAAVAPQGLQMQPSGKTRDGFGIFTLRL